MKGIIKNPRKYFKKHNCRIENLIYKASDMQVTLKHGMKEI